MEVKPLIQTDVVIIARLAKYLNLYAKINFATTCRSVKDAIYSRCLFDELPIPSNRVNEVLRLFQKKAEKQYNGRLVKRLELDLNKVDKSLYFEVPNIFPNLTELFDTGALHNPMISLADPDSFNKWRHSLVEYNAFKSYKHTTMSIQRFEFPHLTHMELLNTLEVAPDGWDTDFVSCLKNTPNLKSLTIRAFTMDLEKLNKIVDSARSLETLTLFYGMMFFFDDSMFRTIKPCKVLKNLIIDEKVKIYDNGCIFLKYIDMKFPKLENLDLKIVIGDGQESDQRDETEELLFHPERARESHTYDRGFARDYFGMNSLINGFTQTDDQYGDDYNQDAYSPGTVKLYKAYLPVIMNKILPRLNNLKIEASIFIRMLKQIKPSKLANLNKIGFYRTVRQFDRTHSVKHLEFIANVPNLTELYLEFNRPDQGFNKDLVLPHRTTVCSLHDIDLHKLLASYPSVEEFDFDCKNLTVIKGGSENAKKDPKYPLIRKFHLVAWDIQPNVTDFISNSLPNVTSVAWYTCMAMDRENLFMFDLSKCSLKHFFFYDKRRERVVFQIETPDENKKFLTNKNFTGGFVKPLTQTQAKKVKDAIKVHIRCERLLELKTDEFSIF